MAWFLNILNEYGITEIPKIFVETGSYLGSGIEDVLKTDYFDEIHSIELSNKWYNYCKQKFSYTPKVKLHYGDSASVLEKLNLPNVPILFFLDAHYSGGETAGKDIDNGCPVLRELDILCKKCFPGDIIVIDDMRLLGNASIAGNAENEIYPLTYFDFRHANFENILGILNKNNKEYKITLCKDIDRLIIFF